MSEVCWPRRASAEVTPGLGQTREDQGPGTRGYETARMVTRGAKDSGCIVA